MEKNFFFSGIFRKSPVFTIILALMILLFGFYVKCPLASAAMIENHHKVMDNHHNMPTEHQDAKSANCQGSCELRINKNAEATLLSIQPLYDESIRSHLRQLYFIDISLILHENTTDLIYHHFSNPPPWSVGGGIRLRI